VGSPLRVLIVEDSTDDALLMVRELERGGYDVVSYERASTTAAMEAALGTESWDVVISECCMPFFDAEGALALLRRKGLDLPFIVVSNRISEDEAVALMRAGAHDYVEKGRLSRLVPVIEREMGAS
jgi:DNA-binding NtrC family response regulator